MNASLLPSLWSFQSIFYLLLFPFFFFCLHHISFCMPLRFSSILLPDDFCTFVHGISLLSALDQEDREAEFLSASLSTLVCISLVSIHLKYLSPSSLSPRLLYLIFSTFISSFPPLHSYLCLCIARFLPPSLSSGQQINKWCPGNRLFLQHRYGTLSIRSLPLRSLLLPFSIQWTPSTSQKVSRVLSLLAKK